MLRAVILGVVQGITEFFPVSSTAHLVLLRDFLGWHGKIMSSLAFDVALHAGTLSAVVYCFRQDIAGVLKGNTRLLAILGLATVPAGVAGLLLEDIVESTLRGPAVIAVCLLVFSGVMAISEKSSRQTGEMSGLGFKEALLIGVAQALALMPGVSRSGITISAALLLGLRREDAARFSFLLAVPVIAGASVLEGAKLVTAPEQFEMGLFLAGFVASLVSGMAAITFLMNYFKRHSLYAFVYYRVALAGVIPLWMWARA